MRPYRGLVHPILQSSVLALAVLATVGSGCAYIGQVTFEEKKDSLDHDGDGAPLGGPGEDCNDYEAKETPGGTEIPYDGFDNDCVGGDVVDADGDKYPGISREDYLAQNPDADWPEDLNEEVDCADDPTIYPNADQINPGSRGQAAEVAYDGIDSDCAGDNDFDQDGDGYMPATATFGGSAIDVQQAFADYVATWGYTHLEAEANFGDCNDFRSQANPGTAPENDAWYDGHDDDCAGNNDFDADADGYMPNTDADGNDLTIAYADFVQLYYPSGEPWTPEWDDCLDQADPGIPAANPADVWPDNPSDPPGDGVDSDCLCDNDYDDDGDGTLPLAEQADFDAYNLAWDCGLTATYDDCDDTDPITYPGAIERIGDAADSDCDGDPDGTPFAFHPDIWWDTPRAPVITKTGQSYAILTSSDLTVDTNPPGVGPANLYGSWLLTLPLLSGYEEPAVARFKWHGSGGVPLQVGATIDVGAVGDSVWAGTNYSFALTSGYATAREFYWNGNSYSQGDSEWGTVDSPFYATSTDLEIDSSGWPWFIACNEDTLTVIRADEETRVKAFVGIYDNPLNPGGYPSGVCFWAGDPIPQQVANPDPDPQAVPQIPYIQSGVAEFVTCVPGTDCDTMVFDANANNYTGDIAPAATNPWAGRQLDYGRRKDGWFLLLETGQTGARLEGPLGNLNVLTDYFVHQFDAAWREVSPGNYDLYVTAIVDPVIDDGLGTRALLSYGPFGGPYTEKVLDISHPGLGTLDATGIGVYADDDRLAIAVGAEGDDPSLCGTVPAPTTNYCADDEIGWIFYGWP